MVKRKIEINNMVKKRKEEERKREREDEPI